MNSLRRLLPILSLLFILWKPSVSLALDPHDPTYPGIVLNGTDGVQTGSISGTDGETAATISFGNINFANAPTVGGSSSVLTGTAALGSAAYQASSAFLAASSPAASVAWGNITSNPFSSASSFFESLSTGTSQAALQSALGLGTAATYSAAAFLSSTGNAITATTASYATSAGQRSFSMSNQSTSGDTALTGTNGSISANVALSTGTAAFTASCSLPDTHTAGDISLINVSWPATSYLTFKVYDSNPATGTVLFSYRTVGSAQGALLAFEFNGTVWQAFGPNCVVSTALSPLLWLKSDALSTGSGGAVTDWQDQSGNGNDALEDGTYPAPIYLPGQVNGHGAVVFNGTSQFLQTANAIFSGSSPRTMIAVSELSGTWANTSQKISPICGETGSNATGSWFDLQSRITGAQGDPYLAGYAADTTAGGAPVLSVWRVETVTYDGTTCSVYYNGVLSTSASKSLNTTASPFLVGAADIPLIDGGPTNYLTGSVAEILVFPTCLSAADRLNEESYLTTKYALP